MEQTHRTILETAPARRTTGKRIILMICLILLVLLLLLYSCRNWLVKTVVERVVRQNLGVTVNIGSLRLDPWHGDLAITDLIVYNPPGFDHANTPTTLARIPSIRIQYDLPAFFQKNKLHLTYLELNLYEMSIIKNRRQEFNLNRIQSLAGGSAKQAASRQVSAEKPQGLEFQIDRLTLTATQLMYLDYSKAKPKTLRIKLGIYQERFTNLNSLDDLVRVVAARVVAKAGLYNLGLPFRHLSQGVEKAGGRISSGLRKAAAGADHFLKGIIKK